MVQTKKQHLIHVITEYYDLPGENSPAKLLSLAVSDILITLVEVIIRVMWRVIVSQVFGVSHSMSSENKPLLLCKCLLKKKKSTFTLQSVT